MIRELLKGKIPDKILNDVPNGYEKIGKALIIFSNKDFGKYNKIIGNAILNNIPNVESVFLKIGKTEGVERVYKVKLIGGKNKNIFLYKENGAQLLVNIRKVFFSPTLQNVRKIVVEETKPDDIVLDMFAGVGPFSIEIAKVAKKVYAIEINKYAFNLLEKNIKLNKVKNVVPLLGDAAKIIKKLDEKFDKIIMNLPTKAEDYLPLALKHLRSRGIIYLFKFLDYYNTSKTTAISNEIRKLKNKYTEIKSITTINAGESAPYVSRICFRIST